MTYRLLRGIMRVLTAVVLGGCVRVHGIEHVPTAGGALLVSNHVGMIDPPLTGAVLSRDDVHYMAKSEQFTTPAVRWLLTGFHAFPVVRGSADREALRHTLGLLRAGHAVLVYPEGSRSADGRLRAPQAGIGFIARHADVPVIPVAVWGTERVLPKGARWPRRAPVHISFGPPVMLPDAVGGARRSNAAVAAAVMAAVAAMLPAAYRPQESPASAA